MGLTPRVALARKVRRSYPHGRGAYGVDDVSTARVRGAIPTCVGRLGSLPHTHDGGGAIPTYVGRTIVVMFWWRCQASYPHVRGAYICRLTGIFACVELSPRAWGLPLCPSLRTSTVRAIPTCVGLTRFSPAEMWERTSYPHVRGAYWIEVAMWRLGVELSPRAWGLLTENGVSIQESRVIPTCVGLTASVGFRRTCGGSYPHVRGASPCPPAVMLAGGVFLIRLFTVEFSSTAFLSTYHLPGRVSRSPQP